MWGKIKRIEASDRRELLVNLIAEAGLDNPDNRSWVPGADEVVGEGYGDTYRRAHILRNELEGTYGPVWTFTRTNERGLVQSVTWAAMHPLYPVAAVQTVRYM